MTPDTTNNTTCESLIPGHSYNITVTKMCTVDTDCTSIFDGNKILELKSKIYTEQVHLLWYMYTWQCVYFHSLYNRISWGPKEYSLL